MLTLAIEASTYSGSVAVLRGGEVLAEMAVAMRGEREERLLPATARALRVAKAEVSALERVVCGGGPGSFTSLRIAAAIAKGIASGSGIPLYSVPSLLLLAASTREPLTPGRYLAALDALRGEHFACEVEASTGELLGGEFRRIPSAELPLLAESLKAQLVGPSLAIEASPHARGVARFESMLAGAGPVDLVAWEPAYGRHAEAQMRWEAAHGRPLGSV